MTAEETIASLEAQLKQALERLTEVTEQLRIAQAGIEELEKLKTPPPAFVKAEKKKPPYADRHPHQSLRDASRRGGAIPQGDEMFRVSEGADEPEWFTIADRQSIYPSDRRAAHFPPIVCAWPGAANAR